VVLPTGYLALRTFDGGGEAWDILFRSRTADILGRSVMLVASVTAGSIVIAVPLAWLTVRTDLPLRRLWSVLMVLPLVIPSYIGGFLVVVALGPRGMLQQLLDGPFGVDRLPEIYGFPGATLALTLLTYPYVLITVRAAMWRLDPSLEETSRALGYGPWTTFLRVTLPLLRPSIAAGSLLVALYTLSDFGAVSLLRYETFTWAIYTQFASAFDRTIAAGLSLVLVVVAVGILLSEAASRGRSLYYRGGVGTLRPPALVRLGGWRWPALAFCAALLLFSLIMPLSILVYWAAQGVSAGEPLLFQWRAAWSSLYVSVLAAAVSVAAALPIAVLTVRYPGRLGGLLERATYLGFALPGIAVALALVFFAIRYATPIYQTLGLLIFAYLVLFISPAVGSARASLLQVSPRLEDAARSLGRGPVQVLGSVTLPLMWPGMVAGAALVFLLTMKELPATLILGPIGFETLATVIWSAASESFFARAAASALLLVVVSSIPLVFLALREGRLEARPGGPGPETAAGEAAH
jgi:iron(III) transport system permease protein